MAGGSSNHAQRRLDQLFRFGKLGALSDAQLLDRFATRRDAAAEAAFEELVVRHGPLVLRVSRSVLRDEHDAEDAFQAVFLILANRAGTIRRGRSVASWLFGVAHRVATRARRSSTRRRLLEKRVAARSSERTSDDEYDPDRDLLYEEIDGLPRKLREPVVLCYLQGLTYAAAAHQLGVSEAAIRGRLARARDRLGRRLTRRGLNVSAGLLTAGAAQARAAVPLTLIQSTARIALGFVAGDAVAVLARGVLISMLLSQFRTAMMLAGFGLVVSYPAWQTVAAAGDGKAQAQEEPSKAPAVQLIHPPVRTIVRTVGRPSFIEASQRTPIYSRVRGYIEKAMVDIGEKVEKGEVLATVLASGSAEATAGRKEAVGRPDERVELARKTLEAAEAEVKAARAAVAEAKAILAKCQAEVRRWDTEVKRLDREVKRGVVDPQVLLESTNQWELGVAARDAARATIARTEAEVLAKEAEVAKAKAELSAARAESTAARDGRKRLESSTVRSASQDGEAGIGPGVDVEAARARLDKAREVPASDERDVGRWEAELKRLRRSVDRSSQADPDARREALTAIEQAEETLRSYRNSVSKSEVDVSIANAASVVARSGPRRTDEDKIDRIALLAPHAGLIVARNAKVLDFVKPPDGDAMSLKPIPNDSHRGAAPIFMIDRIDEVRVLLDVPEKDARYVHVGARARISVKGYGDEPIEARVARVSWATNVKKRTLRAEIDLPNPGGRLRPGMYAFAEIILGRPGVRVLPLAAVTSSGDKFYCWLLEDGRAVQTEIKTGISDGKWIEVDRRAPASRTADSGDGRWTPLDGSEQVILGDLSALHDGGPVRVDFGADGSK